MRLADLIRLTLLSSIALLVFSLGLRATLHEVTCLFRRPGLLARALFAMNIVMPAIAIWLVLTFELKPAVKIALVALSVSPVPPMLPRKQLELAGGSEAIVYGLLVSSAVLSVVLVPVTMEIIGSLAGLSGHVRAVNVLSIVATSVLIPMLLGLAAHRFIPEASVAGVSKILGAIAMLLMVLAFLPVLVSQWSELRSLLGDGTIIAILVTTALGLAVGHFLGGPDPGERSVLALATASRHPAVAIAVATAVYPDQKLAPAAVLLALIVGGLAAAPYKAWRKRSTRGVAVGPTSNC